MNYPQVLYCFPEEAGKSFRPSNGTEGMIFNGEFCEQCIHERWVHHQKEDKDEDKCEIWSNAIIHNQRDKEYPEEWQYSDEGWPICTNWQHFDWGDDNDPNEPGDDWPYKPIPVGPNQLSLFPLSPTERDFDDQTRTIQAGPETGTKREKETKTVTARKTHLQKI